MIYDNLTHLIQFKSQEIEIVVSDNASPDNTEETIKQISDLRVKYFKNRRNYGIDGNILKCAERAKGQYIFYITDEDFIDLKELQWLIDLIKKKKNLALIIGAVSNKRKNQKEKLISYGDGLYKPGVESISAAYFKNGYLASIIIRRDTLDLEQAKKYVGCIYLHQVLMLQAMLSDYTLLTSKILSSTVDNEYPCEIYMDKEYCKGEIFGSPLGTLSQLEDRLLILNDLLIRLPKLHKKLIGDEIITWGRLTARIVYQNPRTFITKFPKIAIILKNNKIVLKSPKFWYKFFSELIKKMKSRSFWNDLILKIKKRIIK